MSNFENQLTHFKAQKDPYIFCLNNGKIMKNKNVLTLKLQSVYLNPGILIHVFFVKKIIARNCTVSNKWYQNVLYDTEEHVCTYETMKHVQIVTLKSKI